MPAIKRKLLGGRVRAAGAADGQAQVAEMEGLDFLVPSMGSRALLGQLRDFSVLYWCSLGW